jgi:hypothetical protein
VGGFRVGVECVLRTCTVCVRFVVERYTRNGEC